MSHPLDQGYSVVDADAVRQFIDSQPRSPQPPTAGVPERVEFSMTPEQLDAVKAEQVAAPKMLPEPDLPLNPALDPRSEELSRGWAMRDPSAPDVIVHVTEQERDEFFRAMLHDRPSEWMIPLMNGALQVKMAMPPTWLQEVVERIAEKRARELPPTASKALWHAEYIRSVLYIRVKEIFHEGVSILKVPEHTMQRSFDLKQNEEHLNRLLEFHNDVNPERFKLLIAAGHVMDVKWNICARKLASGNFWSPAGTV